MEEVVQCSQPATRSLVTPGNGVTSGTRYWCLLLADQVSLDEWTSMLLSPCITPISATMAISFIEPLSSNRDGWGKRPTVNRMGQSSPWSLNFSSTKVTLWWTFTWDLVFWNSLPIWRDLSTYFFPWCLSHQFSNYALFKSLTIHPILLAKACESVNNHTSVHFSFQTCINMSTAYYEYFFCWYLSMLPQKGIVML